uniref:Histone H2A n=1 Tax=Macrostomum lignano TaxID=282301 RepID=A0A1I8FBG8_9PLAT
DRVSQSCLVVPVVKLPENLLRKQQKSKSSLRLGLVMPVARVHRYLKLGRYGKVSVGASVYLAAVMEYLVAEVNELSGNAARANKRKTVTPRHIMLGVRNDAELNELLKHVHISFGGVLPSIPSCVAEEEGQACRLCRRARVAKAESPGFL